MSASVTSLATRGVPPGAVRVASELTEAPADLAVGRLLPVRAELAELLPLGGLRRGSTISVRGSNSLLHALLATATTRGSWAGVVGLPDLGLLAAAELGVALQRLAVAPRPGGQLVSVVSAMLDGMDLVVVDAAGLGRAGRRGGDLAKRLSARARHRGAVLIAAGAWPGADLELSCTELRWFGLGDGRGYLAEGQLVISATGRGVAARRRERTVVLPCAAGSNPANPNSAAPTWTGPVQAETDEWIPAESPIAAVG
ncbi:MAG TPA: hypothetical protein VHZ97_06755 [Pseudonocardiaceae bacterium]|nr:hypothetical protein [Pseudonocardiaceae bacterium]